MKQKKVVHITTFMFLFTVGTAYLSSAKAQTVTIGAGEGISYAAKKAGCADYLSPTRWQSIAQSNGYSDWQTFNNSLQPNQVINVNCTNVQTSSNTSSVLPVNAEVPGKLSPVMQSYGRDSLISMIQSRFGNASYMAIKVAQCESGINTMAVNWKDKPYPSVGLFQIMSFPSRGTIRELQNPQYNIDFAYRLSKGGTNWDAWTCKP